MQEMELTSALREWTMVFMRRSFRDFRRFMEEADLSPSQVTALMHLMHCGECGITDIGEYLGVSVPAASQMVDRLVGQGVLVRSEGANDRRFKQVALTEKGRELLGRSFEARLQWLAQLTASFTPEEQQLIARALTLLTDAAREMDAQQA
jgi:MarR family 2-MHQ and catechol resistance regulon transcriptional repressor